MRDAPMPPPPHPSRTAHARVDAWLAKSQAKDLPAILAYRADLRNEIAAALGEAPATHANADQGALLLAFAAVAIPFAAVFLSQ